MKKRKLKDSLAKFQVQKRQKVAVAPPPMKKSKSDQKHDLQRKFLKDIENQRKWTCSLSDLRVLLIGEGNFSFALALAKVMMEKDETFPCKIYATSYDSESVAQEKYEDVKGNVEALQKLGCQIAYNVDATKLSSTLPKSWKGLTWSKVIFNHPHAGAGIKDQDRNIRTNQELLMGFFSSVKDLLLPPTTEHLQGDDPCVQGQVIITLKQGTPYDLWDLRKLATNNSFKGLRSWKFESAAYPGYEHRRTLGFVQGLSKADNQELEGKLVRSYSFIAASEESTKVQAALERHVQKQKSQRKAANFHSSHQSDSD